MKKGRILVLAALAAASLATAPFLRADPNLPDSNPPGWTYSVLPDATFLDDCPICGRPSILEPVSGTFRVRLLGTDPLFVTLALEDIDLVASRPGGEDRHIHGSGTLRFGGEVVVRQDWLLQLDVDDGATKTHALFTNNVPVPERAFPMMAVALTQTNGTFTKLFHLELPAAPFADLWFSTRLGFTPATLPKGTEPFADGDVLSIDGHAVRRYPEMLQEFGFMPLVADHGLDALDLLPAGELAFSVRTDGFGEQSGPVLNGDLLSDHGSVLRSGADLLAGFGVKADGPDVGLDGAQTLSGGEILFSTQSPFVSPSLNEMLGDGDLLSNHGRVVSANADLLALFPRKDPTVDQGLGAFHVWPSGEVWFAVERGFQTTGGVVVAAGDVLSDAGYVVVRNHDLLRRFSPLEDVADFGIDALAPISDWEAIQGPLQFTGVTARSAGLHLEWKGPGRVFQLLGADDPAGPWTPVAPIVPDLAATLPWTDSPPRFLRLRQW